MSAVLVTCRHISYIVGESLRDGLKISPQHCVQSGRSFSRNSSVNSRTILVHVSPIVVGSPLLSCSEPPVDHGDIVRL